MTAQYDEAKRLLPIIATAARAGQHLTYQIAAEKLGRPKNNARTVAQVCDLLDAAAALADVPLLALTTVLTVGLRVNPAAWADTEPEIRNAIINRSKAHKFTNAEIKAIDAALDRLKGYSNRTAWPYLATLMPSGERRLRLAGVGTAAYSDAIDDLGTDSPGVTTFVGKRYARDPQVRAAVIRRAGGRCEYCGELGFECANGSRYLECHHILALADDGADRMTNVIAICPGEHREVHFGKRRSVIETEMIAKVKAAEALRATRPAG
ncbi:HNH endonuclease [Bradyrhizobium sp. CCBAU 65884]|uniref:HNH endonuclease n=1 Tax=Bradyrhizobium sp. CCBAU 65884 TaxID=722477 RepID=UPI002305BABE|nr:HNH endonuclease signature motif containing protein [Bradyrhizobium sp. CCBAU 65884]